MAYSLVDSLVGAQPIAVTSTVQQHVLGKRVRAYDPTYGEGEFIYLAGLASTAVGEVCSYDEKAGTTVRVIAATRGPCAVAMSANVALQYGWYQIFGSAVVKAGTVVAGAPAYSTATPGSVDDTVVTGSQIDGMVFKTADGTPAATFAVAQISYPSLNGNGDSDG